MGIGKENLFVLVIALLTWGGVFIYLLGLDRRTRELERRVEAMNHRDIETQGEEAIG